MFLMVALVTWGAVNIAWSLRSVEQTLERIAEMANRTERLSQSILQQVYGMGSRQ